MADSLDKTLENSPETQTRNLGFNTDENKKEKKPESIDDVLESGEKFDTSTSGVPMTGSKLWKIAKAAGLIGAGYGISALAFGSGMSAIYSALAFGVGNIVEKKVMKQKWTLDHMLKDMYTGALLTPVALWAYGLSDYIAKGGIFNKIAKWSAFALVGAPVWIYGFQVLKYFRDYVGWKKAYDGCKDGKIFGYMKKAHKYSAKQLIPGMKSAISNFGPIWFYTMNYLNLPPARLLIGNINDVLARFLLGGKGVKSLNIWKNIYNGGKKAANSVYQGIRNTGETLKEKLLNGYTANYSQDYKLATA
jgi:hypothetical protein